MFTIDPRVPLSEALRVQALDLLDRRPDLVRRRSRNWFVVPSWTQPDLDHQVALIFASSGWRVTCDCGAVGACKHGWVAAIKAERDDGTTAPTPSPRESARAS